MVTSIKEGVEDYKRAKSDEFENHRDVAIVTFSPSGEEIITMKKSKHINPGDVIKLTGQTAVPVDMLLILTSLYNDGNKCFIETANLDGETNLKVKEAPPLLAELFPELINNGQVDQRLFNGSIEIQEPNKNMHKCTGNFSLKTPNETIPVSMENLILRSCLFSNTDWAYGIAIYTGQETKIQMNNRLAPSKMSKLERALNTAIMLIFSAQEILVSFSVASIYFMNDENTSDFPYIYPNGNDDGSVLPLWLSQW
jgi:magnesium-transporting ATPase (P-type)